MPAPVYYEWSDDPDCKAPFAVACVHTRRLLHRVGNRRADLLATQRSRENRLRLELARIGFRLVKSTALRQDHPSYRRYFIVDPVRNLHISGPGSQNGFDLDAAEKWLADRKAADA